MSLLQVVSGLRMGSVYASLSPGLTFVWGRMNVVNFAHGGFGTPAMYAAIFAFPLLHVGPVFLDPGAAALIVEDIVVNLDLRRHVAKGPTPAERLGPFGLTPVLRHAAFRAFTANFVSLPNNPADCAFDLGGSASRHRARSAAYRRLSSRSACISC